MNRHARILGIDAEGELLLQTVVGDDRQARQAWSRLHPSFALDLLEGEARLLLPALASRLSELGLDEPLLPLLTGMRKRSWYTSSLLLSDLRSALDALDRCGVPALAIRGAATAVLSYPHAGQRVFRDVDVMVHTSDMRAARETLCTAGWTCTLPARPHGRRRGIALLHNAELRTLRLHDALSPALPGSGDDADLWARATTILGRAVELTVPAAEERLLQTCVDAFGTSAGPPLRGVADAVMTARTADVDWERFVGLAGRHRASRQARTMLEYVSERFGAPVPDVLEGLVSAGATAYERVATRAATGAGGPLGRFRQAVAHVAHTADRASPGAAAREVGDGLARLASRSRPVVPSASPRRRRGARRRATGRLVEAAVRSVQYRSEPNHLAALVAGADLGDLPEVAAYHHVVGFVQRALTDIPGVEHRARARLASLHLQARQRHQRALADLHTVNDALQARQIRWLVVKGPVLSEHLYGENDLRAYNDLDLVVPRAQFALAVEALVGVGYELKDKNWVLVRDRLAAEVNLRREGGSDIDLHWHLLYGENRRSEFRIDIDEIIGRASPVAVGDLEVLTFDPADTVIHLGLHAAMEGGNRLVWLADLDWAVRAQPDWDAVAERARRWRVHLPVGTMLLRTQAVLGTEIPAEVIRALVPNAAWRETLRLADRLFPPGTSSARGNLATLLARASRSDLRSTVATVIGGLAGRARHAASTRTLERHDVRGDPTHPGSLANAQGGDRELTQYLDAVRGGQ